VIKMLKWKTLRKGKIWGNRGAWESKTDFSHPYIFLITYDKKNYVLDAFDSHIKDADEAHLDTEPCKTLTAAKKYAEKFIKEKGIK